MKETAVLPDSESPLIPTSGKKIKMEDRKRPYNDTTDDGHPSKRQAVVAPSSSQPASAIPQSQEDVIVSLSISMLLGLCFAGRFGVATSYRQIKWVCLLILVG